MKFEVQFGSFLARLARAKARLGSSREIQNIYQLVSSRLADFEFNFGSSGSSQRNFRLVPPLDYGLPLS